MGRKRNLMEGLVLDASACLGCAQPCEKHETLSDAMLARIDTEKPLYDTCKGKPARAFFVCSGQTGMQWSKKPGKTVELNSPKLDVMMSQLTPLVKARAGVALYVTSEPAADLHQLEGQVDLLAFPDRARFPNVDVEAFAALLDGATGAPQPQPRQALPEWPERWCCGRWQQRWK